jgi:uncharacterized protein YjbI with pentapeptide repeats
MKSEDYLLPIEHSNNMDFPSLDLKENLDGERCIKANMTFANLNSCDLARANLNSVSLHDADLTKANLTSATTRDTSLKS